ncbi:hypothetical protein TSUD_324500 [Trifolium subterraneum]|uniref:Uncharacterized protein n=1 Tax=Trifolium subterraneum TaxID=3900 RepID=A0A2Z6P297_TRISU|nr:hypothetical protein TSUD_324500 [Trifolium subterraneum]
MDMAKRGAMPRILREFNFKAGYGGLRWKIEEKTLGKKQGPATTMAVGSGQDIIYGCENVFAIK